MSVSRKLIIYCILLHIAFLSVVVLGEFSVWVIVCTEILLIGSLIIGVYWINGIRKQQDMINTSIENLRSKDFTIQLKKSGSKEFDLLVDVYNRMIENLRKERVAANELNYFLASIIRASPSGIVLFDFDDNIKSVNPSAEKLLGIKEKDILGKGKETLSDEMLRILYYDRPDWKVVKRDVNNIIRVYGGRFINRGFETRFVLFEDFSQEVYEMEKASYETIVRMMSHEVNNTTGAVNSVLDTYIGHHIDNYSDTFKIIRDRNDNLGLFMQKLSDIARLPDPELVKLDLVPVIRQVIVLIKAQFKDQPITWDLEKPEGSFMVKVDQAQVEQVFINVLTNAAEAISGEGKIEIGYDAVKGWLFIRNNGESLTEEQQQKAFSSFFTTKDKGKGIGLMLTREILTRHNSKFHLKTLDTGMTEFGVGFNVSLN